MQSQRNSWVLCKNDFTSLITTQTQCQHYLSYYCYEPEFDQIKGKFLGTSKTDSNICPSNICLYPVYLSCYWPNSDQTLNIDSFAHHYQMPAVTVTFIQATYGRNLPRSTSLLAKCHQITCKADVLLGSFFQRNAQILLRSFNER